MVAICGIGAVFGFSAIAGLWPYPKWSPLWQALGRGAWRRSSRYLGWGILAGSLIAVLVLNVVPVEARAPWAWLLLVAPLGIAIGAADAYEKKTRSKWRSANHDG